MSMFRFRPSLESLDERIVPDAAPTGDPGLRNVAVADLVDDGTRVLEIINELLDLKQQEDQISQEIANLTAELLNLNAEILNPATTNERLDEIETRIEEIGERNNELTRNQESITACRECLIWELGQIGTN